MKHTKAHISVPESRSFNLKKSVLSPETYKIHSHNNFELNYIVSGWGTRFTGDNIDSFAAGENQIRNHFSLKQEQHFRFSRST